MRETLSFIVAMFLSLIFIPITAFAKPPLPFMPSEEEFKGKEIQPTSTETLFGGLKNDLQELLIPVYDWGISIITAIFVIGTIVMILSLIMKNGQWQKFGQTTMLYSFVVMLLLRGLPIIILSIQSSQDISIMLDAFLRVLSSTAIYLGMIGIGVSLLFFYGYRLIEHPDFYRWSRALMVGAGLMMALALLVPILFPVI